MQNNLVCLKVSNGFLKDIIRNADQSIFAVCVYIWYSVFLYYIPDIHRNNGRGGADGIVGRMSYCEGIILHKIYQLLLLCSKVNEKNK